jgi:K+-transporting ATPase A subunit
MKNPNWLRYTGIVALIVFLLGLISSAVVFFSGSDFGAVILILFIILPIVCVFVFAWLIGLLTNFLVSRKMKSAANILLVILLIIPLVVLFTLFMTPNMSWQIKIIYGGFAVLLAAYFGFLLRVKK